MSLIMDEVELTERMLREHDLGAKPYETLDRVARYYWSNKYSKREIRQLLDNFMLQCDPDVQLPKWADLLDKLTKNAHKYPLIRLDGVTVTKPEMEVIDALRTGQLRRLAFTLLCVSKYWDAVSPNNNHWVNTSDKEVLQMANISTSIKRQCALYGMLRKEGLLKFSKKIDNLNVQVLFGCEGEQAMYIQDFRSLGYQYLMKHGGDFFQCVNCGNPAKLRDPKHGRNQKYCAYCAAEIKTRQNVDSVMRTRKPDIS
jgi:hypothetical protein